jgi:type III restriction enzyme
MIKLKPFQEEAISDLRKQFLELWKTGNRQAPITFKAPTGSGKTIMLAQFLRDLTGDPQFDADKAFVWFSFSEESYEQSKQKLYDYYGGAGEVNLLDLNDLSNGKLEKNDVFFMNWQKIKATNKEGRKLRAPSEKTTIDKGIFDEFIINTQNEKREIILLIDEAHTQTGTELANEVLELLDPRLILHITATPKNIPNADDVQDKKAGYVRVKREDVVEAGLIKEKIVTQTREDLEKVSKNELEQEKDLMELAFNKRIKLKKEFKKIGKNINPLVLVQLPNDDKATKETANKLIRDIVVEYLKEKEVKDTEIAVWLSEEKENLEEIEKNDSDVSFLIFKQAAATGWDCPRAHILVMYREIKKPSFHTQTVGRVLRMPEAQHYEIQELNQCYLFTNYNRKQVSLPDKDKNRPFVFTSKRKDGINPINLDSIIMSRVDYNDLGATFQKNFAIVADDYFGTKDGIQSENRKKIEKKGLKISKVKITNQLIVDAEIEDYDNFVEDIRESGEDFDLETSQHDIERTYNLLCYQIISKQEEPDTKFAPERSWGKLKSALNVWFGKRVAKERTDYYKIIVKDLLKEEQSKLMPLITKSLKKYKPVRQKEVRQKEMSKSKKIEIEIPNQMLSFSDEYEELPVKKAGLEPFYIREKYNGRQNEENFINYLEKKELIVWWHKNGDMGSEHFAIPYYKSATDEDRLFYPDWIAQLKNGKILIVDTKGGGAEGTEGSQETKDKAEELQRWAKKQKLDIIAGIVVQVSKMWKINRNKEYNYDPNHKEWENLEDVI